MMTDELLPCPYCGGENIELAVYYDFYRFHCSNPDCYAHMTESQIYMGAGIWYGTVGEARDAWNTRAAMEFDNWFYLPKPKEQVVEATETTHAWDGMKVKTDVFYQVREQAVANWAKELDEHIIKRICEVWNPCADDYKQAAKYWQRMYEQAFAERTCEFIDDGDGEPSPPKCSVCGYDPGIYECAWYEDGTYGYERSYCPNCGCKVVEE